MSLVRQNAALGGNGLNVCYNVTKERAELLAVTLCIFGKYTFIISYWELFAEKISIVVCKVK